MSRSGTCKRPSLRLTAWAALVGLLPSVILGPLATEALLIHEHDDHAHHLHLPSSSEHWRDAHPLCHDPQSAAIGDADSGRPYARSAFKEEPGGIYVVLSDQTWQASARSATPVSVSAPFPCPPSSDLSEADTTPCHTANSRSRSSAREPPQDHLVALLLMNHALLL
jgi:hypothetical protein